MTDVRESGLFGDKSVTRKIYSSTAVLLGWPRAVLMQLAHPLIAAGVADHSGYQSDPLGRLLHTLDAALAIVFGDQSKAMQALKGIDAIHGRVHGVLSQESGRFPAGTAYDARDPSLLLWVHATVIDSDLSAYQRFAGSLSETEQENCYQERKVTARALGIPSVLLPKTLADMRAYVSSMVNSDAISVAPFQRRLARAVLYPALKVKIGGASAGVPQMVHRPMAAITASLLPDKLCREFGLKAPRPGTALKSDAVVRGLLRTLPAALSGYPRRRFLATARRQEPELFADAR